MSPRRDDRLAERVASAARSVTGVVDLHTGRFGEVATYLPGRRVDGVRLGDELAEVHVVLTHGCDVRATAERIRAAVTPLVDTEVLVAVEDLVAPPQSIQETP